MKYKTGDKVRVISEDHPGFCKGQELTLCLYNEEHKMFSVEGHCPYLQEISLMVYPDEIEPVTKLEKALA